jgi:hypothetical protein
MDSVNSDELHIQGDFCLEKLGHRAVSLSVARELGKRRRQAPPDLFLSRFQIVS